MHFTHLHVHSNYSFCRGANTIDQLCHAAQKRGFTHLALTDTNGIYGLGWFLSAARAHGLQPLHGTCLHTESEHCALLAKNAVGYSVICKAITALHHDKSFNLGNFLKQEGRNVVILSDDLAFLQNLWTNGYHQDVYAELVPHHKPEAVLHFARQLGIPVAASNAVHLVDAADAATFRMLRAIDLNTTLERLPEEELISPEATLKTFTEMSAHFPHCPEALQNAQTIAQQCSFDLDLTEFIFPEFHGPTGETADDFLRQEVRKGVQWRYGSTNEQIERRLAYELEIIVEKKFAPYFLVVADIVRQAPRTCGRGSAAASLVSYCLGITHVDPIKYNLFFERFLNHGRIDPPDIDVDFPWDERDDILDYIFKKYGADKAAMIANHNCFQPRSAVREIAKVYGLPDAEINAITRKMSGFWHPHDIWQHTQNHPAYRETPFKPPWPEIIRLAEKIRDYPRHLSIHCGGVVIAPNGLNRYVATQPAKKVLKLTGALDPEATGLPHSSPEKLQVVQWEKDQSEDMKLVKMDILGNRSLAVIRDALRDVERNYGIKINYAEWDPLQDEKTQALLQRGDTIGVFYVESPAMRLLQQKTKKGDFEYLVIHSSIIRPAANTYIHEYVRRLKGGAYKPLHPLLETLLQETYGIMVYQEDVSRVAMALADFSPAEADELRKIISKKHKEKQLEDYWEMFFAGAQRKQIPEETCEKIWQMILSFSGYSFCKPHSASYAQVSFKSAYLRVYYPAEFMAAVISNQGGFYSTFAYISEARRMGLQVLMPDINLSEFHYTGINAAIRVGFMQLKGINRSAVDRLLADRKRNGAYRSFQDLLKRVALDPSDAAILVKSGCFDALEPNRTRPELLWQAKSFFAANRSTKMNQTLSLFDKALPQNLPQAPMYDEKTVVRQEIETLGFLLSRHPLSQYQDRLNELTYIAGKDLSRHVGKRVTTVGWYVTGKATSTRKDEMMEFISFEDTTAIYETVFFPQAYNKFIHMISNDRPYLLKGLVQSEYDAVTLTVEHVEYL
jgi:error-prone DNA polymerase